MQITLPKPFTHRNASSRILLAVFFALILAGTVLLMLPFASTAPGSASFLDAFFTAASSVCVTGLTVQNTASYWTPFGKLVILLLIQIGGLGVLTGFLFVNYFADKGRSIVRRNLIKEAISGSQLKGLSQLSRFIIVFTLAMELIGAIALMPRFCADFGFIEGGAAAIFHSVSAFCNAGFDILPGEREFVLLASYAGDAHVLIVTTLLVIIGGIGFITWDDIRKNGRHLRRYRLQSKLVLLGTAVLLAVGFLFFYVIEFRTGGTGQRALSSWFCSVMPRTAGFSAVDYSQMSDSSLMLTSVLMLIGGASGSTAGGIKISSLMVCLFASLTIIRGRKETVAFNRRIEPEVIQKAFSLFVVYILLLFVGSIFISCYEGLPIIQTLFECASALATVGLSCGITPGLSAASKLLLIAYMYFGRIGVLTLAYAVSPVGGGSVAKHVVERVNVG